MKAEMKYKLLRKKALVITLRKTYNNLFAGVASSSFHLNVFQNIIKARTRKLKNLKKRSVTYNYYRKIRMKKKKLKKIHKKIKMKKELTKKFHPLLKKRKIFIKYNRKKKKNKKFSLKKGGLKQLAEQIKFKFENRVRIEFFEQKFNIKKNNETRLNLQKFKALWPKKKKNN